ncbi:MAG: hypothetical protein KU37_03925 [Sulfuricurvum sp. PC08-66]|nr:MAG: hypothetical protein KU37_03925 [Sulfuricurvum sp. PC08-66]
MQKKAQLQRRFFWFLVSLYLLNDLIYLYTPWEISWFITDYVVRIITLGLFFWLYKEYVVDRQFFYFNDISTAKAAVWGLSFGLFGIVLFLVIDANLSTLNFYEGSTFPTIENPLFYWFDMSVGLLLVAFSEELLFHSYFYTLYKDKLSAKSLVLISTLLFTAIHWSNDITNILGVAIWAFFAMILFIRLRTIWPLIVAHTVTNMILFMDIIPQEWVTW